MPKLLFPSISDLSSNICKTLLLGILLASPGKYLSARTFTAESGRVGYLSASKPFDLEKEIKGKIVDENGASLAGANIVLQGTAIGTVSNDQGEFSLQVPDEDGTLVVSYIGYVTQEIAISNQSSIDVSLVPDGRSLDELVVVGYGTQRKRDITTAVTSIDPKNVGAVPASNLTRLIQGQAPGVVTKQTTGAPGSQFQVRIRGLSSLGSGSDPLYVIDGFPMGTNLGTNINPNDIQNVTILKDAASTAIYGARGANGVVLITTKNGVEGQQNLNISVDYGIQNVPDSRKVQVLNGPDFSQFLLDRHDDLFRYNYSLANPNSPIPNPPDTSFVGAGRSTNWYDAILHNNAPYTDINLSLDAGKGPIKSLISLGYYKEDGALLTTSYDRISARANLGGKVNNFITVGLNINGSFIKGNEASTEGRSNIVGSTLLIDPREPIYDDEGDLRPFIPGVDGIFGFPNPVYMLKNILRQRNMTEALSNAFVEFTFLKDFKFRTSANARLRFNNYKEYIPSTIGAPVTVGSSGAPPRIATSQEIVQSLYNWSTDQLLSYAPNWGENHVFDALLGFSAQEETFRNLVGSANTFPDDLIPFLGAGSIRSSGSDLYGWSMLAYIARVNYAFKDRYLFSASFRREGSSRFSKENQYGNFPAFSAGWRVSEEPFMPKTAWLNDLKLRASWGMTGNNNYLGDALDGNYASQSFLVSDNYILGNGFSPGRTINRFGNADLTWEKSNQLDLGADLTILDNSLTLTLEYYNKITTDMIMALPLPSTSGFTSTLSNVGKVRNNGFEVAADFRRKIGSVNFRTNANISFNRNKILALRDTIPIFNGSYYGGYNVQKLGRPIGMIYGYDKIGIFNTEEEIEASPVQDGAIPGAMKFRDANGDGVVTEDTRDMIEIGNPWPKFTWGWTVAADYKFVDISVLFTGAHDFDIYRNIEASTMNIDGVFNVLEKVKDRWRSPENPGKDPGNKNSQGTTNYWKWSRESSSRYIYDGTYTWIRNITLGFTLPKMKSVISNAKVFVSANNLLVLTKYPGGNPDTQSRGANEPNNDDEAYPVPRIFSIGARLTF